MITIVGSVTVIIVEVNIMESWQVSQYEEILKKAEARAVDYPGNQDMVDWVLVENDAKWRLHVWWVYLSILFLRQAKRGKRVVGSVFGKGRPPKMGLPAFHRSIVLLPQNE